MSAWEDGGRAPTAEEVREALGEAHAAWEELRERLAADAGVDRFEWAFAGKKYGWSCRAERGKRRIAYLIPQRGAFLVGLVLGDRALTAAKEADLSDATRAAIEAAPRYGEGTGFRLPVRTSADLADVHTLVDIKARP